MNQDILKKNTQTDLINSAKNKNFFTFTKKIEERNFIQRNRKNPSTKSQLFFRSNSDHTVV